MSPTLVWRQPLEIELVPHGPRPYSLRSERIPTTRGVYMFAHITVSGVVPLYIGSATRSIKQRVAQHVKDIDMMARVTDSGRRSAVVFVAELTPGDLDYAKRYLPSYERALILAASKCGGCSLNKHQRAARENVAEVCHFVNAGYRPAWQDWSESEVMAELLPPRAPAA